MSYPEHEKLFAVKEQSQKIGEFLEWLQCEKHVKFRISHSLEVDEAGKPVYRNSDGEVVEDWRPPAEMHPFTQRNDCKEAIRRQREEGIDRHLKPDTQGETDLPLRQTTQVLLAAFFDIDLSKLEKEKRQMLAACREANRDGG